MVENELVLIWISIFEYVFWNKVFPVSKNMNPVTVPGSDPVRAKASID